MKKIISMLALGFAFTGVSAFADTTDVVVPTLSGISSVSPVTEPVEGINTKNITRIKARGAQLISQRVKSLNQNAEAIASAKTLSADQKSAFTAFFNGKISELNTLGMAIASSTDASSTKALVTSIFTDYRIYAVVIPQVRLQKRIYDVQNHATKLTDTFAKVQANIDAAKAKGKDVTVWQKSLDDAKVLVATDTLKLTALMTQINALKPADYPTVSKQTITAVNSGIKSVVNDLNSLAKKVRRPFNMKNVVGVVPTALHLTSWTWVSSTYDGVATTSPDGGKFVLSFLNDKRINSKTDCNTLNGTYIASGSSSLSFGPMMSTMMYCEGSKEGVYADVLAKTSSYKIEGATLTLLNDKGGMTFTKKN